MHKNAGCFENDWFIRRERHALGIMKIRLSCRQQERCKLHMPTLRNILVDSGGKNAPDTPVCYHGFEQGGEGNIRTHPLLFDIPDNGRVVMSVCIPTSQIYRHIPFQSLTAYSRAGSPFLGCTIALGTVTSLLSVGT